MTRENRKNWVVAAVVASFVALWMSDRSVNAQSAAPEGEAAFHRMVDYLAREGGQWRAPNPRHQPSNPKSADAIGLWFETAAQGKILELSVVFHYGDEVRHSTRGFWYWHPGRKEIVYQEVSPGGSVRTGTAHFENENTFITLTESTSPSGAITLNRGVNEFVDGDSHRTAVFAKGSKGEWVEQNALTWTRTTQQDGQQKAP